MAETNLISLSKYFADENEARNLMERLRWKNGPICPHCGSVSAYKLTAKPDSKNPVRDGVYKCKDCRKQFTVTVGTIFHKSRIPLNKWLAAIYMMCASKKGVSAHQLHRELGITYKSAWFMCHRIREAMSQSPFAEKIKGIVEADETYVGGKPRKDNKGQNTKPVKRGRGTKKTPVAVVVQRGKDGKVQAKKIKKLTGKNLRTYIQRFAHKDAIVMTDNYTGYNGLKNHFALHLAVNHSAGEYANGPAHVNTAESWNALLKRGVYGTFHHISEKHMDRYVSEFVFRWNNREVNDFERTIEAIAGVSGKKLTYKSLICN